MHEISSDWCPYYNQGLFIGSDPTGGTKVSMCCWQKQQKVDAVRFDHSYLQNLRDQATQAIPKECSPYCNIPGHVANEKERSRLESCWDSSGVKIKKLHLEQSLACNLTCITCSSRFSSAWNRDYHLFDPTANKIRLKKNVEKVWQDLDLDHVQALHFTGGEPMMNPDNEKILEHLDKKNLLHRVALTYNTNGTIRASDSLLDLWRKVHWVRLNFSLDGIKSTFEYTRYPAEWKIVEDNIRWYREVNGPCILIEVNAIVGIHNVFNMAEFYQWWKDNCQTGNQGDASQIFIRAVEPQSYGGKVLHLRHLPTQLKKPAQDLLQTMVQIDGVPGLMQDISTDPNYQWQDYFDRLDLLRNTDWRQSLSPILDQHRVSC